MKKLLLAFLLIFSSFVVYPQNDFHLLPSPQVFAITGTSQLSPQDLTTYQINRDLTFPKVGRLMQSLIQKDNAPIKIIYQGGKKIAKEGYSISINNTTATIEANDKAGILYAFMSLQQLWEEAKERNINLPNCNIKDYPSLSYRAIHLDVKHHLEKESYYYDLIDELAKYKVNAIIAEMEDKLKYELRPTVASADAMSIEKWKKLSDYAMERNIEISPLIQGLGHASFILKHQKYAHLRDDPKSDWAFNPLDPQTYEVQFDLYRDALKATPHGKYLHIGGDEVYTTGRGSGKSELDLQLEWLNKVCKFAEDNNRIPIFWDDMPLKYADVYKPMFQPEKSQAYVDSVWKRNESKLLTYLDKFPKNCVYMRWNYSSPQSLGNIKAMEWFESKGLETMGATAGQTRWALIPSEESNLRNIKSFAINSIATGQKGLLLTLWDDDSPHFETYKRGILGFAEFTWAGQKRSVADVKKVFRKRYFSGEFYDSSHAFIDILEKHAKFWETAFLKAYQRRNLIYQGDKKHQEFISIPDPTKPGKWSKDHESKLEKAQETYEECGNIARSIHLMKTKTLRNRYTLEVYEQINKLIQFSAYSLLEVQKYDLTEGQYSIQHLSKEFEELRKDFEGVYDDIRILEKPDDYILDSDMHRHMANQTINFDWQFIPEMHYLEKLSRLPQPKAQ